MMNTTERNPIAIIVLDTLRADMLQEPTLLRELPNLRRLIDESYVFSRAYAPSHWTLPSHASLFTGLDPHEHQAHSPYLSLRSDCPTLAEIFGRNGYFTACVTANPWLSEPFGMLRGFRLSYQTAPTDLQHLLKKAAQFTGGVREFLTHRWPRVSQTLSPLLGRSETVLRTSPLNDNGVRTALRFILGEMHPGDLPLFLVVNLMEVHEPYFGRGRFASWRGRVELADRLGRQDWRALTFAVLSRRLKLDDRLRDAVSSLYWENAKFLDSQLGRLLRGLEKGPLGDGYIVILSDHGQALGEKVLMDHLTGMDERLIRIPLLLRTPEASNGGWTDRPVSLTSLFHLLCLIAEGHPEAVEAWLLRLNLEPVISEAHGNAVPDIIAWGEPGTQYWEDQRAFKQYHDHPALACISGTWKLICHLGRKDDELFDLGNDPDELRNVAMKEKPKLAELHEALRKRILRAPTDVWKLRRDGSPIEAKVGIAQTVLRQALAEGRKTALVWTGGKDSTLVLHFAKSLAPGKGLSIPDLLFVDHGQHFQETWDFANRVAVDGGLSLQVARNEPLVSLIKEGMKTVPLTDLDGESQEESLRAGLEGEEVPLDLDTAVGNHLLKTVALNRAILEHGFDTVISGIRWDENPARAREVFFSPREDPPHIRVHPILTWTEREVWDYTLKHGLPIHPLYERGYRSFDGVHDSKPTDTRPAWE